MPLNTSTQILQSQSMLMARYTSTRYVRTGRDSNADGQEKAVSRTQARFEASYASLGIRVSDSGQEETAADAVQINLSSNLTISDANKILKDQLADRINSAFREAGVEINIREVEKQNQDTSPEATARRIVDFATGFLGVYAENHAKDGQTEQLDGFMSLIRDAIDKGFADARDILNGIADISGPVSDNIDKTYDLTQKGLDDFYKKRTDLIAKRGDQGGKSEQPATTDAVAAQKKEVTI